MSTFQGSRPAGGARWCDTVAQAKPGCSKARLPASQTSATYWGIQRLVVVWLWKQCEVSMLTNRRTREAQRGHHRIDRVDNRPGKHWRKRDAIGIRSASSGTSIQYTSSMKRGILLSHILASLECAACCLRRFKGLCSAGARYIGRVYTTAVARLKPRTSHTTCFWPCPCSN